MKRNIVIALAVLTVLIQLIRPERTAEPVDPSNDMVAVTESSAEVEALLRAASCDRHSGQWGYPWYVNVAPFSWWL